MSPRLVFAPKPGFRPLPETGLLIVVGLTGVGKTSFTRQLGWPLLPNRRWLVDSYVLPRLGADPEGLDRKERFELTARWRNQNPGGLAAALAAAYVEPVWPLVFDGLRGEEEVVYARRRFPAARFVVLEAPLRVRLERLLGRADAFDRARVSASDGERLLELAAGLLSAAEVEELLNAHPASALAEKLQIIAAEQQNYHPDGPRRALAGCRRALFIDTTTLTPPQAARRVREWLEVEE